MKIYKVILVCGKFNNTYAARGMDVISAFKAFIAACYKVIIIDVKWNVLIFLPAFPSCFTKLFPSVPF